ncbi:CsgE family curli-type amyloid fiber assembly protein [Marivirga salinae]|uniref:Curli production assembly/transport component CsgE n=1 Tax=Marivirga salinarum TaxID=3059078 RepID=A0AA49GD29_9BACT|nr:CsgE family curli-type amyloid fiber assembly protein [Marivirga sp. BDSF4-3]WKK74314.1 CsgE family curli-type amyloid fiber assembly protein [Marivirga sp. BDSF4-3]
MKTLLLFILNIITVLGIHGQDDSVRIQLLKEIISHNQDSSLEVEMKNQYENEINELIVNETMTKAGNDFHELFYSLWVWPEGLNDTFIMLIKEKPLRGNSTQVSIIINDILIFEMPLQPRYDYLVSIVEMAVNQANAYLYNYEEIKSSLEGDDVKGTGIF